MPPFRSPSAIPFRSLDLRQAPSDAARPPSFPSLSRPSPSVPHYLALFHIIAHKWWFLPSLIFLVSLAPHSPIPNPTQTLAFNIPSHYRIHRACFSLPIHRHFTFLFLVDAISSCFLPRISSTTHSLLPLLLPSLHVSASKYVLKGDPSRHQRSRPQLPRDHSCETAGLQRK